MATVLIVDDDEMILKMYEFVFKENGMEVLLAKNGNEALAILETQKPQLVLLDIMMPEMSGIDLLKKLHDNQKLLDLNVFVLTNFVDPKIKSEAYALGAKDYLVKSDYTPNEIYQKVTKALT